MFNENIEFNIETLEIDNGKVFFQGWLFAQQDIVSLGVLVNFEDKVRLVASYGLISPDVEKHHGSLASSCRFSEMMQLQQPMLFSFVLRVAFVGGYEKDLTVMSAASRGLCKTEITGSRSSRLGIGITTYRRTKDLMNVINKVLLHTRTPFDLIVADDGSNDDTTRTLHENGIPFITGVNRGVAWNKNRALYHLNSYLSSDVMILLEDDTYPSVDGWERDWIEAATRYGHINLAGHWFKHHFLRGSGTVDDPIISEATSGQCVAFSREAIERVGYFDSRFGRYGFEHIEHTERCIKAGYGGFFAEHAEKSFRYYLIPGGVTVGHMMDFHFVDRIPENAVIYHEVQRDQIHRWAWRGDDQMKEFLLEQKERSLPLTGPGPNLGLGIPQTSNRHLAASGIRLSAF